MNTEIIARQFARMGARFRIVRPDELPRRRRRTDYARDIVHDRRGQVFELQLSAERETQLDMNVLQCARHERHLLLLVKSPEAKHRFLCGHDEREWFVAAVPGGPSTVIQAKLALQPGAVQRAADEAGLNQQERVRRHNRAFIRQGEWFFVPVPDLRANDKLVLRDEPIRRGGGKPHLVAQVYRTGGEKVYVCARHPNGLTERECRRLLDTTCEAKHWNWQFRVRNAGVYARGSVRHPDHATVTLHDWHQVMMNTENTTGQMANLAFID